MIGTAICFVLLEALPINFSYSVFAVILFFTGLHHGLVRRHPTGPAS